MTVPTTIDANAWLSKYLTGEGGDQDLARAMLAAFAETLMSAQASMMCEAGYNERSEERVTLATVTASGGGTRGSVRSIWPSRSCARAAIGRTGCWCRAGGPSRHWSR